MDTLRPTNNRIDWQMTHNQLPMHFDEKRNAVAWFIVLIGLVFATFGGIMIFGITETKPAPDF